MSEDVITNADQITADWLTRVLTASGALDNGVVETFDVVLQQFRLSTNARLRVRYAADSHGKRPPKLFLKMVKTESSYGFFGDSEINYYFRDYVGLDGTPLVPSYHTAYSAEARCYHLLLADVSDTHVASIGRKLTIGHGRALADGLARLHAYWWGPERLTERNDSIPNAAAIQKYVSIAQPGARPIIQLYADQLKPHWSDVILQCFDRHSRLMIARSQNGQAEAGFTVIHGDLNAFNILVPLKGDRPIYLIDRQPFDWSLTTWLGVSDFIFPLVIDSEVDARRRLEKPILKHYHDCLIKYGVRDYSWEQLWQDYRLSVVMSLYTMSQWSQESRNEQELPFWIPLLQRSMTAVDDLECAQLWTP